MSFVQCLLVSVFCIVSGNEFPLYGSQFGWYVLGRPLIGGFVCGIILGDVAAGIQLGVAVQLVWHWLHREAPFPWIFLLFPILLWR